MMPKRLCPFSIRLALLLIFQLGTVWGSTVRAQFNTAVQDGVINPGEYGSHVNGQNQETNAGTVWYMTWDANNLYLAFSGSNLNEAGVIYLDDDPMLPVNGGTDANGSLQGFYTYDRNHMMQPFRADFVLYYKLGYHEYRHADGAGYWGAQTANTLAVGTNGGTNTVEIAIPWNVLTQGAGRPATFNWYSYKVYDYGAGTNGIYQPVPPGNPACACNQDPSTLYATQYYNVLNTNTSTATLPFSTTSFTYSQDFSVPGTGGYYLNGGTFYDITVHDNSANNLDNDPVNHVYDNNGPANRLLVDGNIQVRHNLYIGPGSALLPADNSGGNVLATMTFASDPSATGSIYNFGRIDPNPEAFTLADINNRRLDLVIDGYTELQATDVFKDRWRMSNVRITSDGSLIGPASDSVLIEFQWGTLDNNGDIEFWRGGPGFVNFSTRGDWSVQNDYFIGNSSGNGGFEFYDVLIGRNSSRLLPVLNGGVAEIEVKGDFENYDEFLGINGTGRIDVEMNAEVRQEIRGNVTETNGAVTTFHNLRIANNNGGVSNNDSADVHFVSFGGGTIDYFITGELELVFGDLVTRDRNDPSIVHALTLRDSATVDFSGAASNGGPFGSCFVDGPLNWEIETASPVSRDFPVGKSLAFNNYQLGDYRHVQLNVDHDAATKTLYTAEMFLQDLSTTYTWPSPVPELITWISRQRYWNISKGAGANVQSATVTLAYDLDERNDGVVNPPALRIVKDDGAGNWVNIAPGSAGGTGLGTGTMTSNPFTAFSDFTLASIAGNQPLPVDLLRFAAQGEDDAVRLDWVTNLEVNSDYFAVERSLDQVSFSDIGQVAAAGNAAMPQAYQLWDRSIPADISTLYYRLRMVDRDGATQYSEIRRVGLEAENALDIFPNPATQVVNFRSTGEKIQQISLRNALGQEVLRLHPAATQLEMPVHNLASGIYQLQIHLNGLLINRKLIVEKP